MYRLTICYGHPADPTAFDEYYRTVHRGLAERVPGIQKFVVGRCDSLDRTPPPYYLVAELSFATKEVMQAALASPEGEASAAADLANFATGGATLFGQEDW